MSKWTLHALPDDLAGKTFVDVGCWEGHMCVEAMTRNADVVVGIDYCTSPDVLKNLEKSAFNFIRLDIFSEKALELPEFDVVHCAGVLYHVENPLSFLFRLRKLCRPDGWLFLETTFYLAGTAQPVMVFHPEDSLDDNPSNWWSPSPQCLCEMLKAVGFSDIKTTVQHPPRVSMPEPAIGRMGIKARSASGPHAISQKLLPRRPAYMPQSSGCGNRVGVSR